MNDQLREVIQRVLAISDIPHAVHGGVLRQSHSMFIKYFLFRSCARDKVITRNKTGKAPTFFCHIFLYFEKMFDGYIGVFRSII